jgi:hypothetical protein
MAMVIRKRVCNFISDLELMPMGKIRNKYYMLQVGLLFLVPWLFVEAQKSVVGNWVIYISQVKLKNKLIFWNEFQLRNYNLIYPDIQQLLLRYGVGLQHNSDQQSLLGYAYIYSGVYMNENEKNYFNEHRIFQQFIHLFRTPNFYFQNRFRTEERFIENGNFMFRFRYFAYFFFPLSSSTIQKGTVYFSCYNEVFLQNDKKMFDRNRFYIALGCFLNKNLRVDVGIMNQMVGLNAARKQLQFALYHNYTLTKS